MMHYYKKNIGDYAKRAGRLSMLQHGAFTLLIDSCYDREKFPTLEEAIDWTWASSEDEIEAVEFVLRKFFILENNVYKQTRIQEELDAYHSRSEQNKHIAIEREAKRKKNNTRRARNVNKASPNQEPKTNNQKPITATLEPNGSSENSASGNVHHPDSNKKIRVPFQKIVDLYHKILPELPRVEKITKTREEYIRQLWLHDLTDINHWENYFNYVRQSNFLMGKVDPLPGNKRFRAKLEWLTKQENFVKVSEDNYHE